MSIFTQVKGLRPKKNAFNLSHQVAQTQNIGQIMPCYLHDGILPNSRERLDAVSVVRMQALLAPLQHKVDLYAHFWYVPYRIIDEKFPKFISGEMERKGLTYDCPVITTKTVVMSFFAIFNKLVSESLISLSAFSDLSEPYKILFGSQSLMCYLNYPSFSDDVLSDSYYIDDYNNDLGEHMNVKRLQAYFYVLAQNYINENFTWHLGDDDAFGLDLVRDMFSFALGDFNPNGYDWKTAVWDAAFSGGVIEYNPVSMNLALILTMLYLQSPISKNCGLPHAWKKDYFTSALPFVQVGSEVSIPLGSGSMQVSSINVSGNGSISNDNGQGLQTNFTTQPVGPSVLVGNNGKLAVSNPPGAPVSSISGDTLELSNGQGSLDFESSSAAITINELRAANALQRLKESYARFGTRFQEWLKGFWNQNSSDRSMNLPEWLGGMKVNVQISEIEQTSSSPDSAVTGQETPLGTLAGKGLGIGGRKIYDRHFEEPGVIVGLCFAVPRAVYPSCGLDRFLLKTNNIYDYLTPQMEHLGEQEVYSEELYYNEANHVGFTTFGYQSRYAEYKFIQSRFRGQFADTLDFWHLGRKFRDLPVLGQEFVTIDESQMRRPFAVENVDDISLTNLMIWFNFDVKYIAPMSRFGTPALLN